MQYLDMFKHNPNKTLRQYITVNKAWIRYYTPEMKGQPKQWISYNNSIYEVSDI